MSSRRKLALFGRPIRGPVSSVDFLHRVTVLGHQPVNGGSEEGADAVADEVRRVLAGDDALSQPAVAEHAAARITSSSVSGPGITSTRCRWRGGLKKCTPRKRRRNSGEKPSAMRPDGDAAGVGGEDGVGAASGSIAGPEVTFHLEILNDGFDDPVALCDPLEVVLEVADGDEAGALNRCRSAAGFEFAAVSRPAFRRGIPVGFAGRHDVQKIRRNAGVGEVGCDAGAHHAGSQNGHASNCVHEYGTQFRSLTETETQHGMAGPL